MGRGFKCCRGRGPTRCTVNAQRQHAADQRVGSRRRSERRLERQGPKFDATEGVGCETCHGPADRWKAKHDLPGWQLLSPEDKAQYGFRTLRNASKRVGACANCHLGSSEREVNHDLIAAGHPDLTFEMDLFSAVMPPHWVESKTGDNSDPWRTLRVGAVAQAVQLREGLLRLSRRSSGPNWPEYAELDCFACHHSLTKPEDSWRQQSGYPGRRAGIATWNRARDVVFHRLAEQVNPDAAGQLQADIQRLSGLLGQLNGSRAAIAETANHAAGIADQIAQQLASHAYNNAFALRVMRGIASDGGAISAQGERTAEQAAMTLDSLYTAYRLGGKTTHQGEIRAVIQGLFDQVNNPSAYSAPNFAAQMQKLNALLAQER